MAIQHAEPGEVVDVRPLGKALAGSKTTTLVKTDRLEIIRLVVTAGKEIATHSAPGELIVQCLEGKIAFTALDASSEHVDFVRQFGSKIYYGDAARLDMLRAAGIEQAKILVIAVDNPEVSLKIAETVKEEWPHVEIFARAYDRLHAYKLLDMGVCNIERETFLSSLEMAGKVLQGLGLTYSAARQAMETFRSHDESMLKASYSFHDNMDELQSRAKQAATELENLFNQDAATVKGLSEG